MELIGTSLLDYQIHETGARTKAINGDISASLRLNSTSQYKTSNIWDEDKLINRAAFHSLRRYSTILNPVRSDMSPKSDRQPQTVRRDAACTPSAFEDGGRKGGLHTTFRKDKYTISRTPFDRSEFLCP